MSKKSWVNAFCPFTLVYKRRFDILHFVHPLHSPLYNIHSQTMADIILSPIIDKLFEKFVSPTFDKLVRYAGIHSEVKKWKKSLSEIQALLNDASQKEVTSESIKSWLNSIQHLAYDIEDILEALATEAACRDQVTEESGAITRKVRKLIPTCCTGFSVSTRMHDKLNDITTKLQDIEKEKVTLGLKVIDGKAIVMNRVYETRLPDATNIIGRQGEKEALLNKLLGEESGNQTFSILPITTLARILYNEAQVQNYFTLKAWVCVSDEFNIFNISKSIFQSMAGVKTEFENLNLLQEALKHQLMDKRFLLVLDDVWSESYEHWDILVRPFHVGALGSKIIITTRKEQLLKELGFDNLEHMQSLSYKDALSLFCQHALGVNNFDSHPNLRSYGETIVKKCSGLPLALRVLGRLLRTKTDEVEWEELSNSEIWRLGKRDGIVPALRLSYHDLDACMKQLFAYCSLFPKDYLFDKEELILLWMAEGFLRHSSSTNSTVERLGQSYFKELLSRSFFQQAPNEESLFVMHDLMNDLATSVAGDFFWRSENEMEKGVRIGTLEKYRHMKLKAFEGAKNLRTFLAMSVGVKESWERFYISHKILTNLLHDFPLVRVLSLRYLCISEVPESIGSLKHLRYLNLGQTQITSLPEYVCNLYSLQTLIVFGCRALTKLPDNFSKLKNLRHFDIRDTPLVKKMPLGIGELKSLQTLSKVIIGEDDDFPIAKLKDLNNLHEVISIKGLEKVQHAVHAWEGNLLQMRLSELEVEWSNVFDGSRKETHEKEVLEVLNPVNKILKKLQIVSYGGLEFPNWVGDGSFDRLTHVSIRGCRKCASLPPLEQLPSLKAIHCRPFTNQWFQLPHQRHISFPQNYPKLPISSTVDPLQPTSSKLILI
ncbi:hypothetical protein OSB04_019634 [Centaurea solstitialis]|uniref:Uncharacterized protein n=1 Tax=Centaurea solstitialis TaxID=347529 RepID=A0AA38T266_9ASTR|nr:hypothetical protein OSB04_019634 [Centaurea solstitialis]